MSWSPKEVGQAQSIGASKTSVRVTRDYSVSPDGAIRHVVVIKASGVTSTTGITAKLQTSVDGSTWVDSSGTTAITTNGLAYIKLAIEKSGDQTHLPLLPVARVVVSTGTGDAITIDSVKVIQA